MAYYAKSWDSTKYNSELAHLMITMANAAYDPDKAEQGSSDLGLSEWEPYHYSEHFMEYGTNKVCHSIATMEADKDTICLLINVRGSGSIFDITQGINDWLGNFNLDSATQTNFGPHKNFNEAAENVYENINEYLDQKYGKKIGDSKIKYFVTGHSRGAAVANLVEYKLEAEGKRNVYGYNFAVSDTCNMHESINSKGFNTIFNISNLKDIVSYIPGHTVDTMFSLKQLIKSGILANKWTKWGISLWFEDGQEGLVGVDAHDPERYLRFLRKRESIYSYTETPKIHAGISFPDIKIKVYATYCPVEVELIDTNGKVLASVIDGVVDYHDSQFGDVFIATVDDQKIIAVRSDINCSLRIVGTDSGTMDYYVVETGMINEESTSYKAFRNVILKKGKIFISVSEKDSVDDTKLYVVNIGGDIIAAVQGDGIETKISPKPSEHIINVSSITLSGISKKIAAGKKNYS